VPKGPFTKSSAGIWLTINKFWLDDQRLLNEVPILTPKHITQINEVLKHDDSKAS